MVGVLSDDYDLDFRERGAGEGVEDLFARREYGGCRVGVVDELLEFEEIFLAEFISEFIPP